MLPGSEGLALYTSILVTGCELPWEGPAFSKATKSTAEDVSE